jgi:hypothetical protein
MMCSCRRGAPFESVTTDLSDFSQIGEIAWNVTRARFVPTSMTRATAIWGACVPVVEAAQGGCRAGGETSLSFVVRQSADEHCEFG